MTPENQNQNSSASDPGQINNLPVHQAGDQFHPAFSDSAGQKQPDHYTNQPSQTSSPSSSGPSLPLSHNYVEPSSGMMTNPQPAAMSAQAPVTPTTNVMANPNLAIASVPKKKKNLWLWIGLPLIVLLILAGGAALAYKIFLLEPKEALSTYVKKVATAKSANFEGTASWRTLEEKSDKAVEQTAGASILPSNISASAKGAYDIHDKSQPKFEITASAKSNELELIKASAMSFVDEIFFKFEAGAWLSNFGVKIESKWYKMKVDTALKDLDKDECKMDTEANGLISSPIISNLPVKDTKRVAFSEKIAGHTAAHYSGEIDFSKINAYADSLNSKLPAKCKITVKQSDFDGLSVKYDLYSSKNFDRLDLKITSKPAKSDVSLTLDTQNYNQSISIEKPTDAKEITNFMEMFGMTDSQYEATPENGRDAQRKSDLRNIKTALESYYNDNVTYPSRNNWTTELTKGGSPYMKTVPKDPKTGQDYIYNAMPNSPPFTSYTLKATLENKNDPDVQDDTGAKDGVYIVSSAQ